MLDARVVPVADRGEHAVPGGQPCSDHRLGWALRHRVDNVGDVQDRDAQPLGERDQLVAVRRPALLVEDLADDGNR